MAHSVFISYQRSSQAKVDVVRQALEANHLTCWMDRSEITPGDDWNRAIDQAVASSQVFVLFLTAACEESIYVKHELLTADGLGLPIIPVRLEDFRPTNDPLLRINRFNYLDAFADPIENYLSEIVATVRQKLLDRQQALRRVGDKPRTSPLSGSPVADIGNLVYEAWVTGFLMPTITGLVLKEGHSEGIDRPYTFLNPKEEVLSHGSSRIPLSDLLKRANGRMMISGDRGSGKTILMLQLVRELTPIPENILDANAPLYLHVGTWVDPQKPADKQPKIRDWIQSRLVSEYHLHKTRAKKLIANHSLTYCFDGLDDICEKLIAQEVAGSSPFPPEEIEYQRKLLDAFLTELKDLISNHDVRVVVTGGPVVEDFVRQRQAELPFYHVRIDPWTHEDLIYYLDQRGIGALATFLRSYPKIEERLIKSFSELQMLGTVFQDKDEIQGLEDLARDDIDRFFSAVYDKYLKIKYDRYCKDMQDGRVRSAGSSATDMRTDTHRLPKIRISLTEITTYVPAIASYISQPGQDEAFRLDTLQPYELPKRIQQICRLYTGILIGAGIVVTAGLPVALCVALEWSLTGVGLSRALTQSLFAVMGYVLVGLIAAMGYRYTNKWGFGAVIGVAFALGRAFASGCSVSSPGFAPGWDSAIHNGVSSFIVGVPIFAAVFWQIRDDPYVIVPIEIWDTDTSKIGFWLLGAAGLGVVFSLTLNWVRGVTFGVLFAVFSWARFGKKPKMAPIRLRPNQAILYSCVSALKHTLGITLIASVVTGVTYGIAYGQKEGKLDAVMALAGMVVVFFFGGIPVLKHVALRIALRRERLVSAKLERWLQTAVDIGLLRQVGGGYAFASKDSRREYASRLTKDRGLAAIRWGFSKPDDA